MNIVEIENVTKTFGEHTAVDDLTLAVPQGSIYGFIGPNGSGKTTTLRMIMSVIYADHGMIKVFGEQASGACSERIGYLPEERGLYKKMKVRELLRFYGGLKKGVPIHDEVDRWLEMFDLTEWANKKVGALSKGMSQKVQFISTVVSNPELIILDEPFTGLDPVNTDTIRASILDLRDKGATIIFSTHDMAIAEKMCDFIFMIFQGKKVLDGTLTSIQGQYGHDTLRISCANGRDVLHDIPGVDRVNDHGQLQELHMVADADPQKIVAEIMSRTRVNSFEMSTPSLHDIFVRIAGPEAKEVNNA
ncbi:MAG: ATP-binding cassette domain-containing protein [candidate division Zixibacteria bacterium]|nr:ATP-binding cassette domain-containing protein [candidate division Zixibacteria bacterium]